MATSGKPNYLGCRVQLHSNFNLELWEQKLKFYEDKHVVNMLRYGFPLGIRHRAHLNRKSIDNHSSAQQFDTHVKKFIDKELQHVTIMGPFTHVPHPLFHCSPMLIIRPKDVSDRRVIVDLSYGDVDAANRATDRDVYEGVPFTLQLPTFDHVLHQVLNLNNPRLIKADISRAFRNVPIDPRDAIKCGIQHQGAYYIDKRLVFGAVKGTMIFQRISDAVRFILKEQGLDVWNYIDDRFAAIEEDGAQEKFTLLCDSVLELGLPLNPDKVQAPSTSMVIMGILVDTVKRRIAIPHDKMEKIVQAVEDFSTKTFMTKRELQSLLGETIVH